MRAGHAWLRPCSPRASFSASARVRCTTGPPGRHAFEPGSPDSIMLKFFWVQSPKWLSAAIGLALGWVAVAAFSQLLRLPVAGLLLVTAGGLFYTVGAIVYVRRRPDPVPNVLGYHELFHVATLVATGCMYASIAFFVLPRG